MGSLFFLPFIQLAVSENQQSDNFRVNFIKQAVATSTGDFTFSINVRLYGYIELSKDLFLN
jgi:hypothetical protein